MKNPIGHKDSTNESAAAERRSKNREDRPPKQDTTAFTEKRLKYIHDRPQKQKPQIELSNYLVS